MTSSYPEIFLTQGTGFIVKLVLSFLSRCISHSHWKGFPCTFLISFFVCGAAQLFKPVLISLFSINKNYCDPWSWPTPSTRCWFNVWAIYVATVCGVAELHCILRCLSVSLNQGWKVIKIIYLSTEGLLKDNFEVSALSNLCSFILQPCCVSWWL